MKRILMIVGLMVTLSNLTLVAHALCVCNDSTGGCYAAGDGAMCYHDAAGWCHCVDGYKGPRGTAGDGDPLPVDGAN